MSANAESQAMSSPERIELPLFVYGALKPGLPGFEALRKWVSSQDAVKILGKLLERDGLPMLQIDKDGSVEGFLLRWNKGQESDAYKHVCAFEPRKQYEWAMITIGGEAANTLVIRRPNKGNPVRLFANSWEISDDPVFGTGLEEVNIVCDEVDDMLLESPANELRCFFRSQMAYLLLWSILERLSAFCLGPNIDPTKRISRLDELPGIGSIIQKCVKREDSVSDSRDPSTAFKLDATNPKQCFKYYYQVRSNLSHRGKGVVCDFEKVHSSLKELLAMTKEFLIKLQPAGADDPGED